MVPIFSISPALTSFPSTRSTVLILISGNLAAISSLDTGTKDCLSAFSICRDLLTLSLHKTPSLPGLPGRGTAAAVEGLP